MEIYHRENASDFMRHFPKMTITLKILASEKLRKSSHHFHHKGDVAESCSSQPGRDRIMPIPIPQGGGGGGYGGGMGYGGYPFMMMGRKKRESGEAPVEDQNPEM